MLPILARISDLKLGDKGVEDTRCLYSCVNQAQGSPPRRVDTQWVRAKISPVPGFGVLRRGGTGPLGGNWGYWDSQFELQPLYRCEIG